MLIVLVWLINSNFGRELTTINHGNSLLFAHKGISVYHPENSTRSFDACKTLGLNAIEADVTQIGDGNLVIFHDNNCNRMLGIDTLVSDVDLGFFQDKLLKSKNPSDSLSVMTIDEFFQRYKYDFFIYLDIKTANYSMADSLIRKFETYNLYERCIIGDANLLFLSYLKIKDERIVTALEGYGSGKENLYSIIPDRVLPDYFSSFLSQIDADFITFLNKKGILKRYIAYGVDKNNMVKAEELGVQNIIMDYDSGMGQNHSIKEYATSLKDRK